MASTATRTRRNGQLRKSGSWSDDPEREEKDEAALELLETAEAKPTSKIVLPVLDIRTIVVRIVGVSPLVVHHWSEKAWRQMLAKQTGEATSGQEKKVPWQDFRDSIYLYPAKTKWPRHKTEAEFRKLIPKMRYGFPVIAFKNAAVDACTSLGRSTISMKAARQAFHVRGAEINDRGATMAGELCEIVGVPVMRQDMVNVGRPGQKVADIRFRAEFTEWETTLYVRYNARVLTAEQVMNLFNTAGFAVGIGEWRAEKKGGFGLFEVGQPVRRSARRGRRRGAK